MRALAVDNDVIVFISRVWQTTATAVRAGDEGFLIDSVVFPDELAGVPAVLEQAGFPVSGLLATHADWDHLLGRLAFPEASLGCGESTAERLGAELGGPQRGMRAFDEEHYVDGRTPLALSGIQALPVPGLLSLGVGGDKYDIQLHPTGGHTADGTAFMLAWLGILICGDYLSPVEIPMISAGGGLEAYRETLMRLAPVLEQARTVIPGHGAPMPQEDALGILRQDVAYLDALAAGGADASLPEGRRTARQKQIHTENVAALG